MGCPLHGVSAAWGVPCMGCPPSGVSAVWGVRCREVCQYMMFVNIGYRVHTFVLLKYYFVAWQYFDGGTLRSVRSLSL